MDDQVDGFVDGVVESEGRDDEVKDGIADWVGPFEKALLGKDDRLGSDDGLNDGNNEGKELGRELGCGNVGFSLLEGNELGDEDAFVVGVELDSTDGLLLFATDGEALGSGIVGS